MTVLGVRPCALKFRPHRAAVDGRRPRCDHWMSGAGRVEVQQARGWARAENAHWVDAGDCSGGSGSASCAQESPAQCAGGNSHSRSGGGGGRAGGAGRASQRTATVRGEHCRATQPPTPRRKP